MDLWSLYSLMKRSRLFEEAVTKLWEDGFISGEMHLGTGEEAIMAGIISQLHPGDAMALDHRGSAALLMRGVDTVLLLREMLGRKDGLCRGKGGHMHLFSKENLAASSGIVGAEGPTVVGFALAAQYLRPGSIAVAFFGEGAMNEGMLMESIHLAAAWNLPVLFVCKDDDWAITTKPTTTTIGNLGERVRGLGVDYIETYGLNVERVWETTNSAIKQLRAGSRPFFLHARCVHLEGHLLGLPLIRIIRNPFRELPKIAGPLIRSFLRTGSGSLGDRFDGMKIVLSTIISTLYDPRQHSDNDPITLTRKKIMSDPVRLQELDEQITAEISAMEDIALQESVV